MDYKYSRSRRVYYSLGFDAVFLRVSDEYTVSIFKVNDKSKENT
jgi:hypothetical protein